MDRLTERNCWQGDHGRSAGTSETPVPVRITQITAAPNGSEVFSFPLTMMPAISSSPCCVVVCCGVLQCALSTRHFPPATKEAYYYRQIFESHFPSATAAECVPASASIACSTAKAIEWDEAFKALVSGHSHVYRTRICSLRPLWKSTCARQRHFDELCPLSVLGGDCRQT